MLDHKFYPDLVDTILSHAPPEVVVSFCSTSKAYRKKLAGWLAHSSVHQYEDETHYFTSVISSAPPLLPFVRSLVRILDVEGNCLCSDDVLEFEIGNTMEPKGPPRDVDQETDGGIASTNDSFDEDRRRLALSNPPPATTAAFTAVHTLRRMSPASCQEDSCEIGAFCPGAPRVHTIVNFFDLAWDEDDPHNPYLSINPWTSRCIVHLAWPEMPHAPAEDQPPVTHLSLRADTNIKTVDLTIVLRPETPDGTMPPSDTAATLVGHIYATLAQFWRASSPRRPIANFTIVGAEAFDFSQAIVPVNAGKCHQQHQDV